MSTKQRHRLRAALAGVAVMLAAAPAAAVTLITEHEAQLPRDNSQTRPIERGPDIVPVYPATRSGLIQSPFEFRVKFQAHGDTRIDLDTLTILYQTIPAIDLTARVRPFVRSDGIDMLDAEVPAGAHRIVILLKDSAGHEGRADIRFEVEK
jgi:hypothetical protein